MLNPPQQHPDKPDKIQIKHRYTDVVLWESECSTLKKAVEEAVRVEANLTGANLGGANLDGASLRGASLRGASLRGANLERAELEGANLYQANLYQANLAGAFLEGANLEGAFLRGASLRGANLEGANLEGAFLRGANLKQACLIDGGQRGDGYRIVGWIKDNQLWIRAGCRNGTVEELRQHWQKTRAGTPLGEESLAILDHIERVAKIRGLIVTQGGKEATDA